MTAQRVVFLLPPFTSAAEFRTLEKFCSEKFTLTSQTKKIYSELHEQKKLLVKNFTSRIKKIIGEKFYFMSEKIVGEKFHFTNELIVGEKLFHRGNSAFCRSFRKLFLMNSCLCVT